MKFVDEDDEDGEEDGEDEEEVGPDPYQPVLGERGLIHHGVYYNNEDEAGLWWMDGEVIQGDDGVMNGGLVNPIEFNNIGYGYIDNRQEENEAIRGALKMMKKDGSGGAPLPEKFDRVAFDSVVAGYETLIVSACGSGDSHRFKLIMQLANQAESLRKMGANTVKDFEGVNNIIMNQQNPIGGAIYGGGLRLNREDQGDLLRAVIDMANPLMEMAKGKYDAEARAGRASELGLLVDSLAQYKKVGADDEIVGPIEQRIRQLSKEMGDDLVPAKLLRGRDADGDKGRQVHGDQMGAPDSDGAHSAQEPVGVQREEVEGAIPIGGAASASVGISLDPGRRNNHHPGGDRQGAEAAGEGLAAGA